MVDGASTFSHEIADAIEAAAEGTPDGSPERQFAQLWSVVASFATAFNAELDSYYRAVRAQLETQEGFNAYVRLAESRRNRVRAMPIFETPLLFASTNIPDRNRRMAAGGIVVEE